MRKKLKLDISELHVDSFDPSATPQAKRGTIVGYETQFLDTCATNLTCNSCIADTNCGCTQDFTCDLACPSGPTAGCEGTYSADGPTCDSFSCDGVYCGQTNGLCSQDPDIRC